MEIFLLISVIALLILFLSNNKKSWSNSQKNKNKTDLPQTPKQDTTANNSHSNAIYEGTGNLTQRIYRINIHFYPDQERCVLLFEDKVYHLKRYTIGTEYEYRNEKGILRIKGDNATLVFSSGRVFNFKAISPPNPPQ